MTDVQMLKRILEESEKAGGPTELRRQLDLNLSLEDRQQQLDMGIEARLHTITQLDAKIQWLMTNERNAQLTYERRLANINAEEKSKQKNSMRKGSRRGKNWKKTRTKFQTGNGRVNDLMMQLLSVNGCSRSLTGARRHSN